MADGRINNGGRRPGAGRKKKQLAAELADLIGKAWPMKARRKAIEHHAQLAGAGNFKSFQLLMAYAYGRPVQAIPPFQIWDDLDLKKLSDEELNALMEYRDKHLS